MLRAVFLSGVRLFDDPRQFSIERKPHCNKRYPLQRNHPITEWSISHSNALLHHFPFIFCKYCLQLFEAFFVSWSTIVWDCVQVLICLVRSRHHWLFCKKQNFYIIATSDSHSSFVLTQSGEEMCKSIFFIGIKASFSTKHTRYVHVRDHKDISMLQRKPFLRQDQFSNSNEIQKEHTKTRALRWWSLTKHAIPATDTPGLGGFDFCLAFICVLLGRWSYNYTPTISVTKHSFWQSGRLWPCGNYTSLLAMPAENHDEVCLECHYVEILAVNYQNPGSRQHAAGNAELIPTNWAPPTSLVVLLWKLGPFLSGSLRFRKLWEARWVSELELERLEITTQCPPV